MYEQNFNHFDHFFNEQFFSNIILNIIAFFKNNNKYLTYLIIYNTIFFIQTFFEPKYNISITTGTCLSFPFSNTDDHNYLDR